VPNEVRSQRVYILSALKVSKQGAIFLGRGDMNLNFIVAVWLKNGLQT
jgi:hypothetical protein